MSAVHPIAPSAPDTSWDEFIAELAVGVLLYDEHGAIIAANPGATDLLGWDVMTEPRPPGWRIRDDTGALIPALAELGAQLRHAGSSITIPIVVTDDAMPARRLWAVLRAVAHRGRTLLLVVLRPVDRDVLRSNGLLDPTTGLPLRALLLDRLDQSLARARTHGARTTVVLADVRGLGEVNRRFGFAVGDELLALLGARLRAGLPEDHTVGRYSGGTFAVVADHPRGNGEAIAARVRALTGSRATLGAAVVQPAVRTSWVTSDGSDAVHELVTAGERLLGH